MNKEREPKNFLKLCVRIETATEIRDFSRGKREVLHVSQSNNHRI